MVQLKDAVDRMGFSDVMNSAQACIMTLGDEESADDASVSASSTRSKTELPAALEDRIRTGSEKLESLRITFVVAYFSSVSGDRKESRESVYL